MKNMLGSRTKGTHASSCTNLFGLTSNAIAPMTPQIHGGAKENEPRFPIFVIQLTRDIQLSKISKPQGTASNRQSVQRSDIGAPNDGAERRTCATVNDADLSKSSTASLAYRRYYPANARTDR
jgi:hypothetical protein